MTRLMKTFSPGQGGSVRALQTPFCERQRLAHAHWHGFFARGFPLLDHFLPERNFVLVFVVMHCLPAGLISIARQIILPGSQQHLS